MPEEEKTFEEIKDETGLTEEAPDSNEVIEEKVEEATEAVEETAEEEPKESLDDGIEAEFPEGEVSNIDKLIAAEESGKSGETPVNKPWIDIKNLDLKKDAKNLFKKPFYIIIFILGVLTLLLFMAMFFEYSAEEYSKSLDGYVKTHHKAPDWHKGELPEELQTFLKEYNHKKHKAIEKQLLIHDDPKAKQIIIGRNYPKPISNNTLKAILKEQNIGQVTDEGVVKTELMNLSGLDLSKLNYKYFRSMVAANLRYTSFNSIEEEGLLFRGASLQYSQFVDAIIPRTNFVRAKLSYSNFYKAITDASFFNNVVAEKAHFQGARLVASNFNNVVFLKSDFSNTIMDGITAKYSNWEGTNFSEASLIGANFKDADLRGTSFTAADLTDVNFEGANLEGASFEGANLKNTNFKNTDVAQVSFKDVRNASFDQLNESKFLLSARAIPAHLLPQKKSWKERFVVPHDSNRALQGF